MSETDTPTEVLAVANWYERHAEAERRAKDRVGQGVAKDFQHRAAMLRRYAALLALDQIRSGKRATRQRLVVITEHHPTCQAKRARRMASRADLVCFCPKSWPIFLDLRDQCRAHRLPAPMAEFKFSTTRGWRFDAAWSLAPIHPIKLALEVDGGIFLAGGGRHNRGAGYRADQEKLNSAAIAGWSILRVLPEDVRSGKAIAWIGLFFAARGLHSNFKLQTLNSGAPR